MTIYFKNGETLHIAGQEGEVMKRKIAYALENDLRDWITLYHKEKMDQEERLELVLNLEEVVAVR